MNRLAIACALVALFAACGGDEPRAGTDAGTTTPGIDGGFLPDGAAIPLRDSGVDGNGACVPSIEICGDRMDQNCDGRDTSCGDTDGDGIEACREGDDLTMCDCDDARTDVRPPFAATPGGPVVAGAPELCDGRDNDCNGRVDESAQCCEGCASLGEDRDRADVCLEDGTCDCSTEAGIGPCGAGQTCCGGGCTDVGTDFANCGFCGAQCTVQADTCSAGECRCGAGPVCDFTTECSGGSC
ncbi:MAG: MopE-related protein [Myxococcota bacterium]|nr:MopE-related protein [Myxococcota bacterium]